MNPPWASHVKPDLRAARAVVLLLAALAGLALGGCAKTPPTAAEIRAKWMEKTRTTFPDPARAREISELVGRLLDAREERTAALRDASNRVAALNADYHATGEQFAAAYQEYENRQREAAAKFREDLFALRRQVSAAEWEALVD